MRILHALFMFLVFVCLVSSAAVHDEPDVPPKQIYVELRCYQIITDVSQDAVPAPSEHANLFSRTDFKWGDIQLHMDGATLEWNGKPDPPTDPRIELIANPKLVTVVGEKAKVLIGQQGVGYFTPAASGEPNTYVYEHLDTFLGISFEVLLRDVAKEGYVRAFLDFAHNTVGKREKLPGVHLDVGHPFLSVNSFATNVVTQLNRWLAVSESAGGQVTFLTLLKIKHTE